MTDDEWLDHLRSECAKAIADYLQKSVNLDRAMRTLSRAEMLGMAEAATARWVVLVSQRIGDAMIEQSEKSDLVKEQIAMMMAG